MYGQAPAQEQGERLANAHDFHTMVSGQGTKIILANKVDSNAAERVWQVEKHTNHDRGAKTDVRDTSSDALSQATMKTAVCTGDEDNNSTHLKAQ